MKTAYIVNEIFDGETVIKHQFDSLEKAQEKFAELKTVDGGKQTEEKENSIELVRLVEDDDGFEIEYETVDEQTLYSTGQMDRCNYKGDIGCFYWFEACWSSELQELVYEFWFQGKKEEGSVKESGLKDWYFRH